MDIMKLFFDFVTPDSHLLDTAIEVMIDTDIIEEINGNKTCEKHLRLLPRARTLWNMLRHSSIVFELCRDDIHQDFKAGELIKPASALEDSSLWEALANTFQQINATEKEHLREVVAKGMQAVFKNCFGPELVSRVLWQGMRYSTSVYYVEGVPPKIEALILRLYGLVTEAEKMLDV